MYNFTEEGLSGSLEYGLACPVTCEDYHDYGCKPMNLCYWDDFYPCNGTMDDSNIHAAAELWTENSISARHLYCNISDWNTSAVTNMSLIFGTNPEELVADLSGWDTSRVTTMNMMFVEVENMSTVTGLENWDTSSVTDMSFMFVGSRGFTGKAIELWDVGQVLNMSGMFFAAKDLDANFSAWDTSRVTDMSFIFASSPLSF